MKYKIVIRIDLESLEEAVNQLLSEGWRTLGGVAVHPESETCQRGYFAQAMIKHY